MYPHVCVCVAHVFYFFYIYMYIETLFFPCSHLQDETYVTPFAQVSPAH